eukprot:253789-Amphidinium_carterae.2
MAPPTTTNAAKANASTANAYGQPSPFVGVSRLIKAGVRCQHGFHLCCHRMSHGKACQKPHPFREHFRLFPILHRQVGNGGLASDKLDVGVFKTPDQLTDMAMRRTQVTTSLGFQKTQLSSRGGWESRHPETLHRLRQVQASKLRSSLACASVTGGPRCPFLTFHSSIQACIPTRGGSILAVHLLVGDYTTHRVWSVLAFTMPQNKDDRVRKEKNRTPKRGPNGTDIVTESEVGTPMRGGNNDPLMDIMGIHEAEPYNTQEHGGKACTAGVASIAPAQCDDACVPLAIEQRRVAPRTMADGDPITKADLASLQLGLAQMLQTAVADGISGLKQIQEKQSARLSALEEANRSMADKLKKLESGGVRAASVPPLRASVFAPRDPLSAGSRIWGQDGAPNHDRRAASEHAPRSDDVERRARQCILSGFKERFTIGEFKELIPKLVDKENNTLALPQAVTFSSNELFSDKIRLEFSTEWDRRTYMGSFITGQPKYGGAAIYCNRVLDKSDAIGNKLRICPRAHILYLDRMVAFFVDREDKPQCGAGWPSGISFDEFLAGQGKHRG